MLQTEVGVYTAKYNLNSDKEWLVKKNQHNLATITYRNYSAIYRGTIMIGSHQHRKFKSPKANLKASKDLQIATGKKAYRSHGRQLNQLQSKHL